MDMGPFKFYRKGLIVAMRADAAGHMPDDETVAAVNRYTLRPLSPDSFVVFTMDLCNNRVDAHFSRFPEEELDKINRLVPGRPFMERHDTRGSLPRGTFFRSRVFRDTSTDYVSVRPDVYILSTSDNRSLIDNIEGGVYRSTSIGFSFMHPECSVCHEDIRSCNHVPGRAYGGQTCHYIMRDVVDVLEGSVVYWGSQNTGFVAANRESVLTLPEALAAARAKYHEQMEPAGSRSADRRLAWPYGAEE